MNAATQVSAGLPAARRGTVNEKPLCERDASVREEMAHLLCKQAVSWATGGCHTPAYLSVWAWRVVCLLSGSGKQQVTGRREAASCYRERADAVLLCVLQGCVLQFVPYLRCVRVKREQGELGSGGRECACLHELESSRAANSGAQLC